jgi:predicted RNA binding protein YcfA (HicA-like mRNA interferase family)
VTVDEVIKLLESDGWRHTNDDERCRQFKHDSKTGTVTLSGQLELIVPRGVLRTLLRHVQLDEGI